MPSSALAIRTFATPTIVHFLVVLLLSAVLNAHWSSIQGAANVWGLIGLAGPIPLLFDACSSRRHIAPSWKTGSFMPCSLYSPMRAVLGVRFKTQSDDVPTSDTLDGVWRSP